MNDVSERQMQKSDGQWFRAKSCDTFGPMGPWIVTRDEVSDAGNLRISLTLDGQLMQDSSTSNLIFNIPFSSAIFPIPSPGSPETFSQPARPRRRRLSHPACVPRAWNVVSVTVEKIGTLTNPVRAPQSKPASR